MLSFFHSFLEEEEEEKLFASNCMSAKRRSQIALDSGYYVSKRAIKEKREDEVRWDEL